MVGLLTCCAACTDSRTTITSPTPTTTTTPTTPQPPVTAVSVAGTWTASVAVQSNSARMTWELSQNGTAVTGPVTTLLPTGIVLMNGAFTGTLTGSTLAGTIAVTPGGIPVYPTCTGQLAATMNVAVGSVSTLTGPLSVVSSTCTVPITSSTITLTR